MKPFQLMALLTLGITLASCNDPSGTTSAPNLVTPPPINFQLNTSASGTQGMVLQNTGTADLSYTVNASAPWLTVADRATGTIAPQSSNTVTLQATCGADETTTSTPVTITSPNLASPTTVTVNLTCTKPVDTTPDAFSFTDVTRATPGSTVTSNTITVSGINAPTPIKVTGGTLIINGVESSATTVKNGDTVAVRVTASSAYDTITSATVTIGTISQAFNVTTGSVVVDTTPDPFSFTSVKNVTPGSTVTSNTITVSGINAPTPIKVTGGTLIINGVESSATTVKNGDTVAVRVKANPDYGAFNQVTVTIGGVSSDFFTYNATAPATPDSTPDPFSFVPLTNVTPGSTVASNAITVTGINMPAAISVTGGTLVINGVPSTATTVNNGDTVSVRVTASSSYATTTAARVTIGGVTGVFTVQTQAQPLLELVNLTDGIPDTVTMPYVTTVNVNKTDASGSSVTVGKFWLEAQGQNFTIHNVKVVDDAGQTAGVFNGLNEGDVVNPNYGLKTFELLADRTPGVTRKITFSFDVDDKGTQFKYTVILTSN